MCLAIMPHARVTDGNWRAKLCVQINTESYLWSDDESEPQAVWLVTSGAIAKIGARELGMRVCDSTGKFPGHPIGCHHNNDLSSRPRATCGGKTCYLNGAGISTGR